ncbi:molybdenum ABC transporter ATP-binding protein [Tabrizicola sp.]|uniref:molybdenum ABC transporter ATP-binding protein n=1 Tax=Tabrizicola sp. TaxID=2005166 RepID=UPI00286B0EF4|nr:molybdenum ABC transporter ATP-binding protein [Tabrizicola sp.]
MTLSLSLQHRFAGFSLDVAFEAPPGLTCLFGRSGSGKTTVINAVAGLLRPDAGRIALGETVLLGPGTCLPTHRRQVGYVFQDARLFPHMTVRQNLAYGGFVRRRPAASFDQVVALLDIGPLLDRRPGALSGGERSRVAIGRALLSDPQLLLMDEPFAALDAARKAEILPYVERLRDETRLPILYVSHALAEVARLATTIIVLERGRVLCAGPAAEILSDPETALHLGLRDAGSILTAVVAGQDGDGLTRLETGAGPIWLPSVAGPPGRRVRIRIAAQDVILARDRPAGLSALNILPATVMSVRAGEGPGTLVQLDLAGQRLLARITRRSAAALGVVPGLALHVIVKSVSVAQGDVGSSADTSEG